MIFPIRTFGDPVLRGVAAAVDEFDDALARLAEDMLETMYDAPGVGLAAPQIGVPKRLFVFDVGDGPHVIANSEVVEVEGEYEFEEGCLSIPGRYWPLRRPAFARVRGRDLQGRPIELAGDELLARVLQHEHDHLDGLLVLSRLGKEERKQALRELREEALGLRAPP